MLAHVLTFYLKTSNEYQKQLSNTNGFHFDIDIYESASNFTAIGAGILVWSRTYETLKEVGLEDAFKEIATSEGKFTLMRFK